jgi:predicted PurR-regulated permease PerM
MQDKHLWEYKWVRDLAILLVVLLIVWAMYVTRSIMAPVVVGFGLAYVFNPLVKWAHDKHNMPHWGGALGVMGAAGLFVASLLLFVLPKLWEQGGMLVSSLHGYARALIKAFGPQLEGATEAARARLNQDTEQILAELRDIDFGMIRDALFKTLDIGVGAIGVVGEAVGVVTYLSLAAVVVSFCFFFFSWRFDQIVNWFKPLIPVGAQKRTYEVVGMMDECIAAIIRGRLIQSLVMGVILSIGWNIVGVPYWLLLGMGCGFLNLVPFAAAMGWIVAVALAVIDHISGSIAAQTAAHELALRSGDMLNGESAELTLQISLSWSVLIWPTVVYAIAQLLDGWVVEPLVQGQATDLDPLTVLLVVLIGGSLAGLLGMLLAIPVAACVKILAREVILPQWREYAEKT